MSSAELRRSFLQFFQDRGHTVVPSSPLVPAGDPTLLFTNAGMVQFKAIFLGAEKAPYARAVTSQKCLRVSGKHNDLENVGPSPRHHTFFEMLGNFSFGDYFKREAIAFAWEYVTGVLKLTPERLSFSVYQEDDESFNLWQEIAGVGPDRIFRLGAKSNFWTMGDTGPCGPNTEIFYDMGPDYCTCGDPACSPALDNGCNRWPEIWNLVFMQYNMEVDGSLSELPAKGVDTGMGLERVAAILQGANTNYDTDLFLPLMDEVQRLLGHSEEERRRHTVSYRVIADHARAVTFMIADGIQPGNEGRGYVLRLLLRRAARHGRLIGFTQPFLAQIADIVIEQMGPHYAELPARRDYIRQVVEQEEERFQQTLSTGLARLSELAQNLEARGLSEIPGEEAFRLYDTYGFPIDLTLEVARDAGLSVDMDGFRAALEEQRQRARAAQAFAAAAPELERHRRLLQNLVRAGKLSEQGTTRLHLETTFAETEILALLTDDGEVNSAHEGDHVGVVLRETPFYVESGGQIGDTGIIGVYQSDDLDEEPMAALEVQEVRALIPGLPVHWGEVVRGRLEVGQTVWAMVDYERRMDIARNHTATHLLHSELRYVLGQHVQQAGSLVTPERLRFDFTHSGMLTQEELTEVERLVNEAILADYPIECRVQEYQEALEEGAMALFGEKYGDRVRVVAIGEAGAEFSKELCGGTHVEHTSQIGFFHIISEGSVGAGVRRVEAVTGRAAHTLALERLQAIESAATFLGTKPEQVDRRVLQLMERVQSLEREVAALQREAATARLSGALQNVAEVDGVKVLAMQVEAPDVETMREMTDFLRDRLQSGVVILGAVIDEKPAFVASVTRDLVGRGLSAARLVKEVARVVGGGGGGRDTMAQAGGRDPSKVSDALAGVPALVHTSIQGGSGA
ncbi:MAG: alanine--tRNA ligase [Anaerolineae bacterium]|nr:alanine--tRNA ligase [Anaerolineae bacterium]